jgi:hypothetical protein
MKKFLFALLTLLTLSAMRASAQGGSSQAPTAQGVSARWSIGLAAGPAFPIGSFHRSAGVDGGSIVAQNGGSAEISGSYRFWRSFSATLVVEGQENKGTGIPYWFSLPGTEKPVGSLQGNDWKMARILTGIVYTLPLTKETGPALLLRLLGGVQKTASPDFKDAVLYEEGLYTCLNCAVPSPVTYPGISFPWSFAYEADAGLQWKFHSRFSAVGYAGYQGSKPSKNLLYLDTYDPSTNSYTTYSRKYISATGTISLRAGVLYDLTR